MMLDQTKRAAYNVCISYRQIRVSLQKDRRGKDKSGTNAQRRIEMGLDKHRISYVEIKGEFLVVAIQSEGSSRNAKGQART